MKLKSKCFRFFAMCSRFFDATSILLLWMPVFLSTEISSLHQTTSQVPEGLVQSDQPVVMISITSGECQIMP